MNTDFVGGAEIVAHIAALEERLAACQAVRNSDAEALKAAKAADEDAAVEALRAGATAPKPTEPKAEAAWNASERQLTVASLALRREREALASDIVGRADEIAADLAEREDRLVKTIDDALTDIEAALLERADIGAHRTWVRNGATGSIGIKRVAGEGELRSLRASLAVHDSAVDREAYLRNFDAWKSLVEAAHTTVPTAWRNAHTKEEIEAACDNAVLKEITRREEAGEDVPVPTSIKWGMRLGVGKFSREPEPDPPPEPDTDSAKARQMDNVRS